MHWGQILVTLSQMFWLIEMQNKFYFQGNRLLNIFSTDVKAKSLWLLLYHLCWMFGNSSMQRLTVTYNDAMRMSRTGLKFYNNNVILMYSIYRMEKIESNITDLICGNSGVGLCFCILRTYDVNMFEFVGVLFNVVLWFVLRVIYTLFHGSL